MLVAPRISECFGLPWSAIVCLGLPYCTFGTCGTFGTFNTFSSFGTFNTFGTFGTLALWALLALLALEVLLALLVQGVSEKSLFLQNLHLITVQLCNVSKSDFSLKNS